MGKRPGKMRIDAFYESHISLCQNVSYDALQVYAGSNPIGGSVIFLSFFLFFILVHACNELYYIHM